MIHFFGSLEVLCRLDEWATDDGRDRTRLAEITEQLAKELPVLWAESSKAWFLTSQMESSQGRHAEAAYALMRSYVLMMPEGIRAKQARAILKGKI